MTCPSLTTKSRQSWNSWWPAVKVLTPSKCVEYQEAVICIFPLNHVIYLSFKPSGKRSFSRKKKNCTCLSLKLCRNPLNILLAYVLNSSTARELPLFISNSWLLSVSLSLLLTFIFSSSCKKTRVFQISLEFLVWLGYIRDNSLIKNKQKVDIWGLFNSETFWKLLKKMLTWLGN